MSSAKRVTLMFSVNVSRLSQTLPNEVLNAPSKELKTSGFGLTSLSTSLAFGYFLFSTLCNVLLISNNNEFIAHVCWSKKRVQCMAQWFTYDDIQAKSTCLALTTDGKDCGRKLAGKNPTNLKVGNIFYSVL